MKFAVVVVLVALALGANSSVVPLGWPGSVVVGHPHGVVVGHPHGVVVGHPHGVVVGHPHSAITVAHSVPVVDHAHAAVAVHGVVGVPHVHSPVQIVTGPHVVPAVVPAVAHGGTFVAKTRGAVHVAPLPGHLQSVVSANLEPAPGTL